MDSQRQRSVVERMKTLLQKKKEVNVVVSEIHVRGTAITKDDIFEREIQQVMKAKTLDGVFEGLRGAIANLEKLDIFHGIEVTLDAPEDPRAPSNAIDVYLTVKEKSRIKAETGTYVGNQEGSLSGSIALRNLFGRAESLQAQLAIGTQTRSAFELAFSKPLYGNIDRTLNVSLFKQTQDYDSMNSHKLASQGGRVALNFPSFLGRHTLSYEGIWREIHGVSNNASFSIREEAGHTLKSSIKHVLTIDRRDHPLLATKGVLLKLTQEYAGLGVGVNFVKQQAELRLNASPVEGFILSGTLQGGVIIPTGERKPTLDDRFFIGGPVNVRGFQTGGLGPQAQRRTIGLGTTDRKEDALGGDMYWAGGASLLTPIPIPSMMNNELLKLHFFVNGGNLIQSEAGATLEQSARRLLENVNLAAGVGLALRSATARLEINYCVPFYGKQADFKDRRFYVGIGFDFL